MLGWIVFAAVLAILLILLLSRASLCLHYAEDTLSLRVRYLFFSFDLFPESLANKPKGVRSPKTKSKKEKPQAEKKTPKIKGMSDAAMDLLRASEGARRTIHNHVVLDRVSIEGAVCSGDAHQTALTYSKITSGVYSALTAVGLLITLKKPKVWIEPDFCGRRSRFRVSLRLWLRPWFALMVAASLLWNFLIIQAKQKARKGVTTYEPTTSPQ